MEANICDINHLDADVLLPPRKRLLAGFKKQASNMNGASDHQPTVASSSSLSSSPPSPSPPPSPSLSTSSNDVNAHLQNLLMNSHLYNPNHSPEEILAASRAAATSAAKAAEVARAAAEEKAAIATKAIAAAKSALDLVAKFSEESDNDDRHLKKNKLKKHVPVELLYRKQEIGSPRTDEELARKLHRAINSSPRISKTSPTSESRGHKHKRAKILPTLEKTKASNGGIVLGGSPSSICNGGTIADEIDSLDSAEESVKAGAKGAKYGKYGQSKFDNGEAEPSHSREKAFEDVTPGKKRGRMKLKKLPLSICSFRDRVNPKEEMITKSSPLAEKNKDNSSVTVKPFFSLEPSDDGVISIEGAPMRKCQDFKAPACVKQNKVMQS